MATKENRFGWGSVVKINGEFKTPKTATPPSELTDPALVKLTIQRPDKTIEVRTYGVSGITRVTVGTYFSLLTLAQEGTYHWRWEGSNGPDAAGVQVGTLDSLRNPDF